jgi:hypothetical protein
MCDFCIPILGRGGMPHTVKDCCLKQSAHCPHCGPGTHFKSACPKKAKAVPTRAKPVASVKAAPTPPHMMMVDTNSGYCEYLFQNNVKAERKLADNRETVRKHLLSREDPLLLVNPPPLNPVCSEASVECKMVHGGNAACMPLKPAKKKLTLIA